MLPSPEGAKAIQDATADLTPADLVGQMVVLKTTGRMIYHGLLEAVDAHTGTLTLGHTAGMTWKRWSIRADEVASCKPELFGKTPHR